MYIYMYIYIYIYIYIIYIYTGIQNKPCLGSDPIGKSFPDLPHTPSNAQLYDAVVVVASQKLGRKCTVGLPTKS